jgi:hypothetical protein
VQALADIAKVSEISRRLWIQIEKINHKKVALRIFKAAVVEIGTEERPPDERQ